MIESKRRNYIYLLSATFIALIYALLYWLQPKLGDDRWFSGYMDTFISSGGFDTFIEDSRKAFIFRINFDNGRFPNLFGSPIMMIPLWLRALLLGASVGGMLFLGAKLARVWPKSIAGYGVLCFCMVLILPWYDSMFTTMFSLNYVVPSLMLLYVACLIFGKPVSPWLCFGLCIFFGWWHEAFCVSAIGGFCGLLLFFKDYRRKDIVGCLLGYVVALAFIYCVPATSYKVGDMFSLERFFDLRRGLMLGMPFYFFILVLCIMLCVKRWRVSVYTPRMAFIAGSAVAGWVLWRCFMTGYRTSWPMLLMSGVGAAYIARVLMSGTGRIVRYALGGALLSIAVLQPLLCIPWFVRLKDEKADVERIASKLKDGENAFFRYYSEKDLPLYTLNKPAFYLTGYDGNGVLPEELRHFNASDTQRIASAYGAWNCDGQIIVDGAPEDWHVWNVFLYFDGVPYETKIYLSDFNMNGRKYYLVKTFHIFDRVHFHHIDGIDFISKAPW